MTTTCNIQEGGKGGQLGFRQSVFKGAFEGPSQAIDKQKACNTEFTNIFVTRLQVFAS